MKRIPNFLIACAVAALMTACGVQDGLQVPAGVDECDVNIDCPAWHVCHNDRCVPYGQPASSQPDLGSAPASVADMTPAPANPASWVARSRTAHVLELAGAPISSANCAALVGWQAPLQGSDKGPAVARANDPDRHYEFALPLYGVGSGRYRVTYRGGDSCQTGQMTSVGNWTWAEYGNGHFQNFSDEGKGWVCQHRNDAGTCGTDIFFDYNPSKGAVTGAGRDECTKRRHDAGCPNLHQ